MVNAVCWFEIYVQDMNRAKKFYEAVFETNLEKLETPDMEMWGFNMNDQNYGSGGALVKMDGCPSGGGGTLVYFSCSDCGITAEKVTANGGKIFKPKFSIGQYGFIAMVHDTEGNMIGLHSRS
jgi:uncharacterized protein